MDMTNPAGEPQKPAEPAENIPSLKAGKEKQE